MNKKRVGVKKVEPVVFQNVCYKVISGAKARGLEQNGGYIGAYDINSDDELWHLKIYDVVYNKEMEADKQDVLITKMSISSLRGGIVIENEKGRKFLVNPETKKVRELFLGIF